MMRKRRKRVYALYQGDEFIDLGTAAQLARILGCKTETVEWQSSASGRRRARPDGRHIIRVADIDEEDDNEYPM